MVGQEGRKAWSPSRFLTLRDTAADFCLGLVLPAGQLRAWVGAICEDKVGETLHAKETLHSPLWEAPGKDGSSHGHFHLHHLM